MVVADRASLRSRRAFVFFQQHLASAQDPGAPTGPSSSRKARQACEPGCGRKRWSSVCDDDAAAHVQRALRARRSPGRRRLACRRRQHLFSGKCVCVLYLYSAPQVSQPTHGARDTDARRADATRRSAPLSSPVRSNASHMGTAACCAHSTYPRLTFGCWASQSRVSSAGCWSSACRWPRARRAGRHCGWRGRDRQA